MTGESTRRILYEATPPAQDEVLLATRSHSTPANPCVTALTGSASAGPQRPPAGRNHDRTDKISHGRGPDSPRLVQHHRRPAGPSTARPASRDRPAGRTRRSRAPLSDGAHRPGGE